MNDYGSLAHLSHSIVENGGFLVLCNYLFYIQHLEGIRLKKNDKALIVTIAFAVFAGVMSTSMITIGFLDLVKAFNIDYTNLQYRNILFFSFFASGLPLFGALADKIGAKKIIKIGLLLFIVSGIISGLATNYLVFLFSQSLQAIADSMIVPSLIVLIRSSFDDAKIGWAFGWFSASLATATLIGPALGGLIIGFSSWRYIFLTLTLIASVAIILCEIYLPNNEGKKIDVQLPIFNTLLFVSFMISFQIVLIHHNIYLKFILFLMALLFLLLFISLEKNNDKATIVPRKAVTNKIFMISLIRVFLLFMVTNIIVLMVPSLMREEFLISPNTVGFIIMIESIIAILFASLAGRLADTKPLLTMVCGMILTLCGITLLILQYMFDINPLFLFSLFFCL